MYGPSVKKYLTEAAARLEKKQPAGALIALNVVLSLQPRNKAALQMQGRIFTGVKQRLMDMQPCWPTDNMLGRAVDAKSDKIFSQCRNIWSIIMLTPLVEDEEARHQANFRTEPGRKGACPTSKNWRFLQSPNRNPSRNPSPSP